MSTGWTSAWPWPGHEMDEQTRLTLLWLAERAEVQMSVVYTPHMFPCATCEHDRRAHVVSGDADDPQPWPCTYPQILGAPVALCLCTDYQPLNED